MEVNEVNIVLAYGYPVKKEQKDTIKQMVDLLGGKTMAEVNEILRCVQDICLEHYTVTLVLR